MHCVALVIRALVSLCDVQVRRANRQTHVRQTPVPTAVTAQHLTPTSSARARPASMDPHAAWT